MNIKKEQEEEKKRKQRLRRCGSTIMSFSLHKDRDQINTYGKKDRRIFNYSTSCPMMTNGH
jgi:hypothetical protein